jgi:hypothetical protein
MYVEGTSPWEEGIDGILDEAYFASVDHAVRIKYWLFSEVLKIYYQIEFKVCAKSILTFGLNMRIVAAVVQK